MPLLDNEAMPARQRNNSELWGSYWKRKFDECYEEFVIWIFWSNTVKLIELIALNSTISLTRIHDARLLIEFAQDFKLLIDLFPRIKRAFRPNFKKGQVSGGHTVLKLKIL